MKTIILTIVILFSFSNMNAQDSASIESKKEITHTYKNTKVDFYEALVAANNFDIKIKKTEKLATKNETKSDFYKILMTKNGFTKDNKKNTRLANNDSIEKDATITNSTQITGLLP